VAKETYHMSKKTYLVVRPHVTGLVGHTERKVLQDLVLFSVLAFRQHMVCSYLA